MHNCLDTLGQDNARREVGTGALHSPRKAKERQPLNSKNNFRFLLEAEARDYRSAGREAPRSAGGCPAASAAAPRRHAPAGAPQELPAGLGGRPGPSPTPCLWGSRAPMEAQIVQPEESPPGSQPGSWPRARARARPVSAWRGASPRRSVISRSWTASGPPFGYPPEGPAVSPPPPLPPHLSMALPQRHLPSRLIPPAPSAIRRPVTYRLKSSECPHRGTWRQEGQGDARPHAPEVPADRPHASDPPPVAQPQPPAPSTAQSPVHARDSPARGGSYGSAGAVAAALHGDLSSELGTRRGGPTGPA